MGIGVSARGGRISEAPRVGLHSLSVRLNAGPNTAVAVALPGLTDQADSMTVQNRSGQDIRVTLNAFPAGVTDAFAVSNRAFLVQDGGQYDVAFSESNPIVGLGIDVPDQSAIAAGTSVSLAALPAVAQAGGLVEVTFAEK